MGYCLDSRINIRTEIDDGATRPWYVVYFDNIAMRPRCRTKEYARVFAKGIKVGFKIKNDETITGDIK